MKLRSNTIKFKHYTVSDETFGTDYLHLHLIVNIIKSNINILVGLHT